MAKARGTVWPAGLRLVPSLGHAANQCGKILFRRSFGPSRAESAVSARMGRWGLSRLALDHRQEQGKYLLLSRTACQAVGGTDLQVRLGEIPDQCPDESTCEEASAETSSLIGRAMDVIRGDFQERTWRAFLRHRRRRPGCDPSRHRVGDDPAGRASGQAPGSPATPRGVLRSARMTWDIEAQRASEECASNERGKRIPRLRVGLQCRFAAKNLPDSRLISLSARPEIFTWHSAVILHRGRNEQINLKARLKQRRNRK